MTNSPRATGSRYTGHLVDLACETYRYDFGVLGIQVCTRHMPRLFVCTLDIQCEPNRTLGAKFFARAVL